MLMKENTIKVCISSTGLLNIFMFYYETQSDYNRLEGRQLGQMVYTVRIYVHRVSNDERYEVIIFDVYYSKNASNWRVYMY